MSRLFMFLCRNYYPNLPHRVKIIVNSVVSLSYIYRKIFM